MQTNQIELMRELSYCARSESFPSLNILLSFNSRNFWDVETLKALMQFDTSNRVSLITLVCDNVQLPLLILSRYVVYPSVKYYGKTLQNIIDNLKAAGVSVMYKRSDCILSSIHNNYVEKILMNLEEA